MKCVIVGGEISFQPDLFYAPVWVEDIGTHSVPYIVNDVEISFFDLLSTVASETQNLEKSGPVGNLNSVVMNSFRRGARRKPPCQDRNIVAPLGKLLGKDLDVSLTASFGG